MRRAISMCLMEVKGSWFVTVSTAGFNCGTAFCCAGILSLTTAASNPNPTQLTDSQTQTQALRLWP